VLVNRSLESAVDDKGCGYAHVKNRTGNKRKCPRRTNLTAASSQLFRFAQTSGTINKRIGRRLELRGHDQAHRNHEAKNPPTESFHVLFIKDVRHHEDERQM